MLARLSACLVLTLALCSRRDSRPLNLLFSYAARNQPKLNSGHSQHHHLRQSLQSAPSRFSSHMSDLDSARNSRSQLQTDPDWTGNSRARSLPANTAQDAHASTHDEEDASFEISRDGPASQRGRSAPDLAASSVVSSSFVLDLGAGVGAGAGPTGGVFGRSSSFGRSASDGKRRTESALASVKEDQHWHGWDDGQARVEESSLVRRKRSLQGQRGAPVERVPSPHALTPISSSLANLADLVKLAQLHTGGLPGQDAAPSEGIQLPDDYHASQQPPSQVPLWAAPANGNHAAAHIAPLRSARTAHRNSAEDGARMFPELGRMLEGETRMPGASVLSKAEKGNGAGPGHSEAEASMFEAERRRSGQGALLPTLRPHT